MEGVHNPVDLLNVNRLAYTGADELTIAGGAITITKSHHSVDTEGGAPDDDLDTINGGRHGEVLYLLSRNSARDIRIRNGVGNIFLKHQIDNHPFSFASPQGGGGTRYAGGGYYDWAAADANLNQGALSVVIGTANVAYGSHVSIVAGGPGVVDTGVVSLTATGTTMDDNGVRTGSAVVTLVEDITALALNQYVETSEKFNGQVTLALVVASGSPVNFNLDFNSGYSKYEDFANQDFTVTGIQCVGEAGANDTGFNIRLLYHNPIGWTYAATGFAPGATVLANMNVDYGTEQNLSSGEPFAYKRTNLNQAVNGNDGEGIVVEITTGTARAVESMSGIIWAHSAPGFSYLSDTRQHLVFMKHGPNWLEL